MNIKNMTQQEKIKFLKQIYTDEISIWEEDGMTLSEEHDKFYEIKKDLLKRAELDTIPLLMELFDDDCYELSWMHELEDLVTLIAGKHGGKGMKRLVDNFKIVPSKGQYHGQQYLLQMILNTEDDYEILKSIATDLEQSSKELLFQILIEIKEKR